MYDDKTKYGEQIPSLFAWMTPDDQKKRADELNQITTKGIKDNTNKDKEEKNRPS